MPEPSSPSMEELGHSADLLDDLAERVPPIAALSRQASWCLRGVLSRHARAGDAPLFVAVVGPGGVGKSTLVSSLAGVRVGDPGVLRPSTQMPAVWGADSPAREVAETIARAAGLGALPPVISQAALSGAVVVDTTPSDLAGGGAEICRAVVACADLTVTVTCRNRYADAVTFEIAEDVAAQGGSQVFLINRLPPEPGGHGQIVADFEERLVKAGLLEPDGDVIAVSEGPVDPLTGALAEAGILPLRRAIEAALAGRAQLVAARIGGARAWTADRLEAVVAAYRGHREEESSLAEMVTVAYEEAAAAAVARASEQSMVASAGGWEPAAEAISAAVLHAAGDAAREVAAGWSTTGHGRLLGLLDGLSPWKPGPGTAELAQRQMEEWRERVDALGVAAVRPRFLRPLLRRSAREHLWRSCLDPGVQPPSLLKRFTKDLWEEVRAESRRLFDEVITAVTTEDGDRFRRVLPMQVEVASLRELAHRLRATAAGSSEGGEG